MMNTENFREELRSIADRNIGTCQNIKDLTVYHDELLATIDSLNQQLNSLNQQLKLQKEECYFKQNDFPGQRETCLEP